MAGDELVRQTPRVAGADPARPAASGRAAPRLDAARRTRAIAGSANIRFADARAMTYRTRWLPIEPALDILNRYADRPSAHQHDSLWRPLAAANAADDAMAASAPITFHLQRGPSDRTAQRTQHAALENRTYRMRRRPGTATAPRSSSTIRRRLAKAGALGLIARSTTLTNACGRQRHPQPQQTG